MRLKTIGALLCAIGFAGAALAQAQPGTAAEAKAMLEKAVAAVKADKAKALDMFNKGEGGFLDRDLYPFCSNISDGKVVASVDILVLIWRTCRHSGESQRASAPLACPAVADRVKCCRAKIRAWVSTFR